MVKYVKEQYEKFLLFAIETTILIVVWQQEGLRPSRINNNPTNFLRREFLHLIHVFKVCFLCFNVEIIEFFSHEM